MFKALYAFKKTHPSSLGFEDHEIFIELPGAGGDKNWYYVINTNGQAGYVPKNYVEKKDNVTVEEFKQTAEGMYVQDCSMSWNLIDPITL